MPRSSPCTCAAKGKGPSPGVASPAGYLLSRSWAAPTFDNTNWGTLLMHKLSDDDLDDLLEQEPDQTLADRIKHLHKNVQAALLTPHESKNSQPKPD